MLRKGILVLLVCVTLVAGVSALLVATQSAEAAFAGRNGKIVFASERVTGFGTNPDENLEILTMSSNGTGIKQLTNSNDHKQFPAWSRNGKKIAYSSGPRFGNADIYVMNADGSNQTNVTNTPDENDSNPSFSPNGKRLVFTSTGAEATNPGEDQEIFTIKLDGTGREQLTDNAADIDDAPTFSPDGTKVAFVTNRDNPGSDVTEIYTVNADGSDPLNLSRSPAALDFSPNWSPDGKKIAFVTNRGFPAGNVEVFVMDADGSHQTNLTVSRWEDKAPAFSPDGRHIVFETGRDGHFEVYRMRADGSLQTRLTIEEEIDIQPDWQPLKKRRR